VPVARDSAFTPDALEYGGLIGGNVVSAKTRSRPHIKSFRSQQMNTLFWILIGAFIGWNFPQPWWAKFMQDKAKAILREKLQN